MTTCMLMLAVMHTQLAADQPPAGVTVNSWVSSQDMSRLLEPQPALRFGGPAPQPAQIVIDDGQTYQSIVGLGSSLEGSTCFNISKLPLDEQRDVVRKIVHPEDGAGMNLMRICIGTADFTGSPWYTYDDMPKGKTDRKLKHFSIGKDREYVLPVLKMALEINPDLRFVASPWSPPGWMTTNDRIGGGRILPEHFNAYARYLAKFIQAYQAEGIPIYAITVQNEPDYNPPTYPTCRWTGEQQRDFFRDHLGPEFERQGIRAKVWCWDHNYDKLEFPRAILEDAAAARYVDGTAFHFYEGKPEDMTTLHNEFPDKHVYFTEGSTFGVRGAARLITILRNWARGYNAWVTVIDDNQGPNPGPHHCSPTCIVFDSERLTLEYRFDYYMYGQFMKFIQRDAVRIASTESERGFANVAFKNPDGSIVLVVTNGDENPREFAVAWHGATFSASLPAQSVATYRWKQE